MDWLFAGRPAARKIFFWSAFSILLFAVIGFLVLPPIVRSVLEKRLTEALHRKTAVRAVRINPFTLSVSVLGLSILDRDGAAPFFSAEKIFVDAQLASAWHRGPVLREIALLNPRVSIVRGPDGRYNFSDLVDEFSGKPSPPDAKPLRFSLNNIRVVEGAADFDDRPKRTRHAVRSLNLSVPFVSNLPYYVETYVQPAFSAVVNGTPLSLEGKSRPFSGTHETTLTLRVRDVLIPYYMEYVPVPLKIKVPSGAVDAALTLVFTQKAGAAPTLILSGDAAIKGLRTNWAGGEPLFSLTRLAASLRSLSMGPLDVKLDNVVLTSPELHLERNSGGRLTLLDLLPASGGKHAPADSVVDAAPGEKPAKAPPPMSVEAASLRLEGGKVVFIDRSVGKIPFRTTLDNVSVEALRFTNATGRPFRLAASLSTESRETVRHEGEITLSPATAAGRIEIERVSLKKYAPYHAPHLMFDVLSGTLDIAADYRYASAPDNAATALSKLDATLSNLRLQRRGEEGPFLELPRLEVRDGAADATRRTVSVGSVKSVGGSARVVRAADGKLNLAQLLPPTSTGVAPPAAVRTEESAGKDALPWEASLGRLALERFALSFEDGVPEEGAELEIAPFSIHGEHLTTAKGKTGRASLAMKVNGTGSLSASGPLSLNPLRADLKVDVKSIDLVPFQPYVADRLNLLFTGGRFSSAGALSFASGSGKPPKISFAGETTLSDFSTADSATAEDLLKWSSLHLAGVRIALNPTSVAIDEVALTDPYSRLIVNTDGTLNVQGLIRKGTPGDNGVAQTPPPAPVEALSPPTPPPPVPVSVGTVTIQGGTILFSDRHIRPNFTARLFEVGGRVSGLSSGEETAADVLLRGNLGGQAPLEIAGKINPLRGDLFVDLKVDFKDIDVSPMTPYAGRYAGYGIERGKLNLSLKYLIRKRKLEAGNTVFIDQFTFGDRVDSPDATKLPVRLAVSLLKDRNGEIHLDIPVTGSLDDPKFSIWGVVWQVVKNLLVKAATSPFALLGAIFGGGEELSYLEFPSGLASIDPAGESRLRILAKALKERPALRLDVAGFADPPRDRESIRRETFERKLRAQKLKDLLKPHKGATAPSTDNVTVLPAEYELYLGKAYAAETFPKPRNLIGIAKGLPPAEMEKLILTHIDVTDDDLKQLSRARAQRVVDFIVAEGKVEPERVFLVEAKSLAPERKENRKDSRVEFSLK